MFSRTTKEKKSSVYFGSAARERGREPRNQLIGGLLVEAAAGLAALLVGRRRRALQVHGRIEIPLEYRASFPS